MTPHDLKITNLSACRTDTAETVKDTTGAPEASTTNTLSPGLANTAADAVSVKATLWVSPELLLKAKSTGSPMGRWFSRTARPLVSICRSIRDVLCGYGVRDFTFDRSTDKDQLTVIYRTAHGTFRVSMTGAPGSLEVGCEVAK